MGIFSMQTKMASSGNGNVQIVSSGSRGTAKVSVNGKTLRVSGDNISIIDEKVFIDGKPLDESDAAVAPGAFASLTKIVIEGNAERVEGACDIEVRGDVYGDVDAGMNAKVCGNVKGDVDAGMNATVEGSVDGDVDAGMKAVVHGGKLHV